MAEYMEWKPHAIYSNCTVVLQYFEVVLEIHILFKQKPLVALLRFFFNICIFTDLKKIQTAYLKSVILKLSVLPYCF